MPGSTAHIDLAALKANIALVRARVPTNVKILFVVKADGYGHGGSAVARAGEEAGVDYLGVVTVDEGEMLRARGIKLPILLLGPILPAEIPRALRLRITIPVYDSRFADHLAWTALRLGITASVHVKVDTGMGRFGVALKDASRLFDHLTGKPSLRVEGVFTQLSSADSTDQEDRAYTKKQIQLFQGLLKQLSQRSLLPPLRHIGNSAGLIQYQGLVTAPPLNMVRIGTLFYGYPEVPAAWVKEIRPVARLTASVVTARTIDAGSFIGYARSYRAAAPRRVAVIGVGYGSGIPPQLANRGKLWIRGRLAPIVGRIYLDHTMIDVTEIDGVSLGDEVEIFGPHLPADWLASQAGLKVCELLVPALKAAEKRVHQ